MLAWVTGVDGPTLFKALDEYALAPEMLGEGSGDRWRANGLRVFAVPVDKLEGTLAPLREGAVSASLQRQSVPQSTVWTEVVRGGERSAAQTIALDTERIKLPPGALRLRVRSWVVPSPGSDDRARDDRNSEPEAMMRLEMLPQHVERAAATSEAARDPLKAPSIIPGSEGIRFQRLKLAVLARGDRAIVIVPERPDVDWSVAPPTPVSAPEESRERGRVGEVQRDRAVPGAIDVERGPEIQEVDAPLAGPRVRVAPTLGEAMLMVDRVGPRSRPGSAEETPLRQIVVLVPRVPRTFTLLGD